MFFKYIHFINISKDNLFNCIRQPIQASLSCPFKNFNFLYTYVSWFRMILGFWFAGKGILGERTKWCKQKHVSFSYLIFFLLLLFVCQKRKKKVYDHLINSFVGNLCLFFFFSYFRGRWCFCCTLSTFYVLKF